MEKVRTMTKPGTRLKSAVCDTEAVVVRPPSAGVISCGGAPMLAIDGARPEDGTIDPAFAAGSAVGKRYVDTDGGLEMLCTKAGAAFRLIISQGSRRS